jgi:hypothetical protein
MFLRGATLISYRVQKIKLFKDNKKSVPLYVMEAHVGRGGIAPTHT